MAIVIQIVSAFIIVGLLVTGAVWLDAHLRGWRRLARRFGVHAPPADAMPARQQGNVGNGPAVFNLQRLLVAAPCQEGLFIAAPAILRHSHPPLLIPWSQIALREERTRLGSRIVRLSVGRVHAGFITLRGGMADEVRARLGEPGA